jgi:tryptophan-rich sensory protein
MGGFRSKDYWLDWSTLLQIAGVLFLAYGSSAMQYSRWNHAYNATVRPLFYPWAVVIGIIMIILAVRKTH